MRLVIAAAIVCSALIFSASLPSVVQAHRQDEDRDDDNDGRRLRNGREIFRFDTFGDEQFWTDVLRMPEGLAAVDPTTALSVGLNVDVEALPRSLRRQLRRGEVDLTNPAVT